MAQARNSRIRQRFTEVDPPSNDVPSDDYLSEPLVSLENALHHLLSDIVRLDKYIDIAKSKCNKSSTYGLTPDESAAIYLYTMEWIEGTSSSLYFIFNRTLRSGSRPQKKRWSLYMKLLVTALKKFPSIAGTAWRIIKEDVSKDYSKDKIFIWPSLTSCSRDIINSFGDPDDKNTLFNISATNAKDISAYSQYPSEQEVVLLPGTRLRVAQEPVLKKVANFNNIPVIHLQEI